MRLARSTKMRLNRARGHAFVRSIKLPIDRCIMSKTVETLIAEGNYEKSEVRAAEKLVYPGDTVIELGGGLGFVSAHLRRERCPKRIVVFEANPELIPFIRKTHLANGFTDIEVRNGVLLPNPSSKTVAFHVSEDVWASSLSPAYRTVRIIDVPVFPFEDVIAEIKPKVLVIDIEGGELDLLEAEDLGSVERVVMEVHPMIYGLPGMARLYQSLCRHGFAYDEVRSSGATIAIERSLSPDKTEIEPNRHIVREVA